MFRTLLHFTLISWLHVHASGERKRIQLQHGFQGKTLRMAAETWRPYTIITNNSDGGIDYSGVMRKVMDYLQESLNFTTTILRGACIYDVQQNFGIFEPLCTQNI